MGELRSQTFLFGEPRPGAPLQRMVIEIFVNTGRMFLEGFDYLYDAAGGYVGYGWNGRVSHEYGGVTPGAFGPRE